MIPASPASPPECPVGLVVRPTGLVLLCVAVPSLDSWREYQRRDARLWLRRTEPGETGLGEPRVEVAAATRIDEEVGTAWVIARSEPLASERSRALYNDIETQGLVDLFVFERDELDSPSPEYLHWLACTDLSRRSEELGLSTAPFPQHYRERSVAASLEAVRKVGPFEEATTSFRSRGARIGMDSVAKVTSR